MDFILFMEKVKKSLYEFFGEGAEISIREVEKNNGVKLHGLTIIIGDANISPTIYMEGFYREYCSGKQFGTVLYEIIQLYEENKIYNRINMDFFTRYEQVRGRVFFKVINYEKNKERLDKLPHRRFLDLAVICYFAYMNDLIGHGFIQIENKHLAEWRISKEQLFADADKNIREKLQVDIKDMNEMIWEMLKEEAGERDLDEMRSVLEQEEQKIPMYVMTLSGKYFGAACIYQMDVLSRFAQKTGKNFYILPSSIHELILLPDEGRETPEGLRKMVTEVNRSHVEAEEQLSDNVYYFDQDSQTVQII